nr:RES family NAD+ phosphorylase [Parvularcula dongshanensis]
MPEPGDGATWVVAAFIYTAETGGRFNGPELGAWYAATEEETAVSEAAYHNERRLRASEGGFPNTIQLRGLATTLDAELLDVRGGPEDLYAPDDYALPQGFAAQRRWPRAEPGEDGLIYDSVRAPGGTNVVLFRPRAVPLPVLQGEHRQLDWDRQGRLTVSALTGLP